MAAPARPASSPPAPSAMCWNGTTSRSTATSPPPSAAPSFPSEDPVAQVLAAFGIFAVGFSCARSAVRWSAISATASGRRAALTFSVAAMAFPTFLVGVLPGYDVLGVAAPILLTLLRMIQGLSVGGEYTTSIVFMVEQAKPGSRGLLGAVARCGAVGRHPGGLGDRRAARLADVARQRSKAWGWRIPFVLGLLVGLRRLLPAPAASTRRRRPGRRCARRWSRRSEPRPLLLRLAALVGLQLPSAST